MEITQLQRSNAEIVNIIVKNVDGSGSITTGRGASYPDVGASIDGNSVVLCAGTKAKGFVGIAINDIPINGFGRVTAWGYVGSVEISNVGSSITITAGDQLLYGAVAGTFFSAITPQATSTLMYKYIYAAATVANTLSAGPSYIAGIVRAL